jgi:hypothetical protein
MMVTMMILTIGNQKVNLTNQKSMRRQQVWVDHLLPVVAVLSEPSWKIKWLPKDDPLDRDLLVQEL